ncbi:MAG: hypothetical protein ACSHXF_04700 [Aquaticitalea sp.]
MKNSLLLIALLIFQFGKSQEIDLSEWKMDSIPTSLKKLSEANNSKHRWHFSNFNDTIKIIEHKYNRVNGDNLPFSLDSVKNISGTKFIKSVYNGFLIGYNHGEFGGGLKFVSLNNDYSYSIELIDKENEWKYNYVSRNIREIFEYNNRIYAMRGLAHMGLNNGGLYEIIFKNGKWSYKYISNLPGTPDIVFVHKNIVYIVTTQNILKFDEIGGLKTILKSPFYWGSLYPSNAFIKGNDIYLAMRKGILIIRDFENNPNYEWYIKEILLPTP